MEFVRDLVRDFIGIIFPGGFLITLLLYFIFCILFLFIPFDLKVFSNLNGIIIFSILLIFSYIAGQFLRILLLENLEEDFTKKYRKNRPKRYKAKKAKQYFENYNKKITDDELEKELGFSCNYSSFKKNYKKCIKKIKELEEDIVKEKSKIKELKDKYTEFFNNFGHWELFPYPYRLKAWRLLRKTDDYNKFYNKFNDQIIRDDASFFHFCKGVIFEYSQSLKDEMLRQESLVRLLAGIYYSIKLGIIFNIIFASLHSISIIFYKYDIDFIFNKNDTYSLYIVIISLTTLGIFGYVKWEISRRLRLMRYKELQLAYDYFYIISKNKNYKFEY